MAVPLLLPFVRDFLVAAGAVRAPNVAGGAPVLWLEPRDGTPAPGDGSGVSISPDVVVGAYMAMGIPRGPYQEGVLRTDAVDFRIRARTAPLAHTFDEALRDAFKDRRGYDLAGLTIVESLIFRPLSWLGSDADGFDFVTQYTFERHA